MSKYLLLALLFFFFLICMSHAVHLDSGVAFLDWEGRGCGGGGDGGMWYNFDCV